MPGRDDDLINTAHLLPSAAARLLLTTDHQSAVSIVGLLGGMLTQWEASQVVLDPIQSEVVLNSLVQILVGMMEASSSTIREVTNSVFAAGFTAGVESAKT